MKTILKAPERVLLKYLIVRNYIFKVISYLSIWCNKFTFRLLYVIIKSKGEDKNDSQKFYKNRL